MRDPPPRPNRPRCQVQEAQQARRPAQGAAARSHHGAHPSRPRQDHACAVQGAAQVGRPHGAARQGCAARHRMTPVAPSAQTLVRASEDETHPPLSLAPHTSRASPSKQCTPLADPCAPPSSSQAARFTTGGRRWATSTTSPLSTPSSSRHPSATPSARAATRVCFATASAGATTPSWAPSSSSEPDGVRVERDSGNRLGPRPLLHSVFGFLFGATPLRCGGVR